MSIREVDVSERPVCPGCQQRDRVEPMGTYPYPWTPRDLLPDAADLTCWWCARCLACLSALPALPVVDPPVATGQGAKRGRKGKD
jgi:hypothetical protein